MCNPAAILAPLIAAPAATGLSAAAAASIFAGAAGVALSLKRPKIPGAAPRIPEPEAKGQTAIRAEESARGRLLSEQEAGKTRRRKLRLRGTEPTQVETGLKIPIL